MSHKTCTSYDPVENLMTDMSNMVHLFKPSIIHDRLYDGFNRRIGKYNKIISMPSEKLFWRAYKAVLAYEDITEDIDGIYTWSDAIAWVYTDIADGYVYETEIYPKIKSHTDIFDILVFGDRKETFAYTKNDLFSDKT